MLKNSTAQPLRKTMGTQKAPGARGTVALGDLPAVATALAGVKPFPAVVQLVRKLAADPKCAASDVARLVEGDVGLVTDILRVVNAPASGLRQRCTGVRHAVTLLGLKRVSEVVVGANEPYVLSASSDHSVPTHAPAHGVPDLELEIRQDLIATPEGQAAWSARLARLIPAAWAACTT